MDFILKVGVDRVTLRSLWLIYWMILCCSWINFVHTIEYKSSAKVITARPRPHYSYRAVALIPTRSRHGKQLPKATVSSAKPHTTTAIATSVIAFNSYTNRPPFGETSSSYYHHHQHQFNPSEDLKNHIKRVLDFEEKNDTLDKYIMNSFNLYNVDPLYVFVLPGENNRKLVFHRSNFTEAIFPDIVPLKQLRKLSYASHQIAHQKNYHDKKAEKYSKSDEIPKNKYDQFKSGEYDLDEAASLRIIEENVRTERNFLEFMEDLNRSQENEIEGEGRQVISVSAKDDVGLNEYEVILKDIQATSSSDKQLLLTGETRTEIKEFNRRRAQSRVSWREMGLDGWLGTLNSKYVVPIEQGKPPQPGLLRHPNEHLISHPKDRPATGQPKLQTITPKGHSIAHPSELSITPNPKAPTRAPFIDHSIALPKNRPFVDTKKFIPILATFDSLAFLTTTSRPSTTVPELPQFDEKIPPDVKSYAFVRLYKHNHVTSTTAPWPSSTVYHHHAAPVWTSTTTKSTDLFSPADGYLNAGEYIHKQKPQYDYKMHLPDGLHDLLKAERERLRNISLTIGYDYKAHRVWPLTTSRSAHRDEDVYIGRANNPFGHSTRWRWNNTTEYQTGVEGRHKRGVIELYSMVKCATGCDPLIYKGYGCYCGFLGSGRALDGIDRCCKMHDYCYATANCPKFLEYFVPYLWKCYRGRPLCAIDHGEWGGPSSCAATLCQCDQALSKCLRRFHCPRKRAVCTSSPARLLQNLLMSL